MQQTTNAVQDSAPGASKEAVRLYLSPGVAARLRITADLEPAGARSASAVADRVLAAGLETREQLAARMAGTS